MLTKQVASMNFKPNHYDLVDDCRNRVLRGQTVHWSHASLNLDDVIEFVSSDADAMNRVLQLAVIDQSQAGFLANKMIHNRVTTICLRYCRHYGAPINDRIRHKTSSTNALTSYLQKAWHYVAH